MLFQNTFLPLLLFGAVLVCDLEARRIRVRPQEDQDDTEYYESQPQDSQEQRVVYISAADQYNGLFGQPSASSRSSQPNYIPSDTRSGPSVVKSRTKDPVKSPPVQTIRNYNKVNDDGSFTFGYEAADGSFKEETRGTDCVVRGKYGYVDPDGNKREFTYVSGNPCDPNAPKEEEQEQDDRIREGESGESDNIPNYPTRPIRPIRPIAPTEAPKSPITLFQNNYVRDEEDDVESEAVLKPQPIQPARSRPPVYIPRPTQYVLPQTTTEAPAIYRPSQIFSPIPSSTPSSLIYKNTITPLSITPRPALRFDPVTTYRPQTLQFAATPKPSLLYTKPITSYTPTPIANYTPRPIASYTQKSPIFTYTTPASITPSPARTNIDFDAEFQKFQQENNVVQPTPATSLPKAITSKPVAKIPLSAAPSAAPTSGPVYSSALLYDPSSGQYNTQLYQTLPQTDGDFTLKHKIQPYVHQPQPQVVNFQQLAQQSPLYKAPAPSRPSNNQALYQQQQSELQFQNSAQLYTQQQKARQQQQQPQQQPQAYQQPVQQQSSPQQFYYIQPQPSYTTGSQIDAFLRGHNIQF